MLMKSSSVLQPWAMLSPRISPEPGLIFSHFSKPGGFGCPTLPQMKRGGLWHSPPPAPTSLCKDPLLKSYLGLSHESMNNRGFVFPALWPPSEHPSADVAYPTMVHPRAKSRGTGFLPRFWYPLPQHCLWSPLLPPLLSAPATLVSGSLGSSFFLTQSLGCLFRWYFARCPRDDCVNRSLPLVSPKPTLKLVCHHHWWQYVYLFYAGLSQNALLASCHIPRAWNSVSCVPDTPVSWVSGESGLALFRGFYNCQCSHYNCF